MDVKTWHKKLGYGMPAVEVPHLLIEFNNGKASALIEYKLEGSAYLKLTHPTCRAIATLALNSDIPFFTVFHSADYSRFHVVPCNSVAKAWFSEDTLMDSHQYLIFMWDLRTKPRRTQQKTLDQLADTISRMVHDDSFYQAIKAKFTLAEQNKE